MCDGVYGVYEAGRGGMRWDGMRQDTTTRNAMRMCTGTGMRVGTGVRWTWAWVWVAVPIAKGLGMDVCTGMGIGMVMENIEIGIY